MTRVSIAVAAWVLGAGACVAAPLQPLQSAVGQIPVAQLLGTAETIGEWKLLNGNGDIRLVRVMSRNGGECEAGDEDDSNLCPRYTLFVVLDGELDDPVDFTAFRLPETLGWWLPKGFRPDERSEATAIPLRACEMKRTAKGFGWRGVSYTLHVTEKLVGGNAPFTFSASLDRLPGGRGDCAEDR
jgi:hypothetical protein